MLDESQIPGIKKQLIDQIESTFPDDKKELARSQIEQMNNEELEQFLIQNGLIKGDGSSPPKEEQCIFCSIIKKNLPSTIIEETDSALAILEINPVSYGHSLVIPKIHIEKEEELDESVKKLSEKIKEKIKENLKPKEVLIEPSQVMGHIALNIIPVYEKENLSSERKQKSPEELQIILEEIKKEEIKEKPIEKKEPITDKNTILPNRIP
jgi:histidine triad (HIT) family protein